MTTRIIEQDFTPEGLADVTVTRFVASDGFDAVILTVQGVEVEIPAASAEVVATSVIAASGANIPPLTMP